MVLKLVKVYIAKLDAAPSRSRRDTKKNGSANGLYRTTSPHVPSGSAAQSSHNGDHHKIPDQGKGTDDHLLPWGDWLKALLLTEKLVTFSRLSFFSRGK